jgi:hypothetical protein
MHVNRLMLTAAAVTALLSACSGSAPETKLAVTDDPNVEIKRTIIVTGDSQCRLKVQKGRDEPELIVPQSCQLTKSGSGEISAVTTVFASPCGSYTFNNLIGELFFLDDKALTTRKPACKVESFNASYGWSLERS